MGECGKTRLSLYGWRSGREFTKSTMPRARSSTKSTIRIFSSISSTTTSQQKIAFSNSSRKLSGNEKRESHAESKPFQNSNVHLFIFVHKLSHSRCFNFISEFAPFIFPEPRRIFITFFVLAKLYIVRW